MPIFLLAVLVTAVIIWAATDKVIYRGAASVTPNNMVHVSTSYKTVMVVPHKVLTTGSNILVGVVSNAKAFEIRSAPFETRQVIVRRRLWGSPRVTRIS